MMVLVLVLGDVLEKPSIHLVGGLTPDRFFPTVVIVWSWFGLVYIILRDAHMYSQA